MVHHTMNTSSKPAPKASNKMSVIQRASSGWFMAAIVGSLVACSAPSPRPSAPVLGRPAPPLAEPAPDRSASEQPESGREMGLDMQETQ